MPRATRRKNPHGYRISDYRSDFAHAAAAATGDSDLYAWAESFDGALRSESGTLSMLSSLVGMAKNGRSLKERKGALDMALAVLGARMNKVG